MVDFEGFMPVHNLEVTINGDKAVETSSRLTHGENARTPGAYGLDAEAALLAFGVHGGIAVATGQDAAAAGAHSVDSSRPTLGENAYTAGALAVDADPVGAKTFVDDDGAFA